MTVERDSQKIVIAGASSLLGAELKALLEESRFAGWDFRLVDEIAAAGTLTEAGGEPAVIQPVEEDSFRGAHMVFFAGSVEFTKANLAAARKTGAKIFDLSGATAGEGKTHCWFPKLDALLGREFPKNDEVYAIPSAAATESAGLTLALGKMGFQKLAITCFHSVSEAGRRGIEELESQTGQLLSFQGVGQPVFDAQVAFNLLDRYGPASSHRLSVVRGRLRLEAKACLNGKAAMPAIQVVHTPVFYGAVFSANAEIAVKMDAERVVSACQDAGFVVQGDQAGPSNVSAAGEKSIQMARPEEDRSHPGTWWFWGAADNIRLPAANAVKLAEMLG
jgi:aspartate-semialdehyde dehydrogenase